MSDGPRLIRRRDPPDFTFPIVVVLLVGLVLGAGGYSRWGLVRTGRDGSVAALLAEWWSAGEIDPAGLLIVFLAAVMIGAVLSTWYRRG